MSAPVHWIIGQGGLLGQSMARRLGTRAFNSIKIDWRQDDTPDVLSAECERFLGTIRAGSGWAVLWCAGAGIIGTEQAALDRETELLSVLLDTLDDKRGVLFLSSSAGGVYGGSRDLPITELTQPQPISPYGHNKLVQESLVGSWARRTGNRVVVGRFTNLYGPGQNPDKPQGLITQICLSTISRQPVSLYVSSDTLRDYVFVDDASTKALDAVRRAFDELPAGACSTKIIGSGSSVSIGSLLGEARRVLGCRTTVILATASLSSQQARTLAFKSVVWPEIDDVASTPLPVGIDRTARALRASFAAGSLGLLGGS